MEQRTELTEIIDYINPATLNYQEWVNIGMALKHEGYSERDWDDWSRRDSARYHDGECERKWNTFHGTNSPVTGGTVVQMALDNGWVPSHGHELDWDDDIQADDHTIIDKNWIEDREVQEPKQWDPCREIITYLETLFESSETIGYVTKSYKNEKGKYIPRDKGNYDQTAGTIIEKLSKCNGDIGAVVGDYDPEAGAWIRFNPLDGEGVRNADVTDYRYALVESDDMPIEKQNAILRELELPIACLVHSGKKSLHAIVRVDAADYSEYRKRVDYLYDVCQKNGIVVDTQNRNPSRLSRMPGVQRGEQRQFLIDTNIGKKNWNEWHEWIEGINDDLPEPEALEDVWSDMPDLAPCLIEGVLRKGHKMLISGPSKAGKSFLQIELCIAMAEGKKWLEWQCTQGRVMYVNLELDRASCLHRFKDVYEAMGIPPKNLHNIDIWNLRGKSVPMDKLAPKLIRRASKKDYVAIIIDPIYKVITGDENSADQMAMFCNQFDKVCTELGCAVIYCHHHSKGAQGGKKSMDRASGSGVFARDPDALIDLIELETNKQLIEQEENKTICRTCKEYLDAHYQGHEKDLSQDDLLSSVQMQEYCKFRLDEWQMKALNKQIDAAKEQVKTMTAWRIDGTLREFPKFEPVNLWFDYPIHRLDNVGSLKDIQPDSEEPPWKKATNKHKKNAKTRKAERIESTKSALEESNFGDLPSVNDIADYLGVSVRTARDRVTEVDGYDIEDGKIIKKNESSTEGEN
jgi:hypothetical protein